jgi:hypothetical protein
MAMSERRPTINQEIFANTIDMKTSVESSAGPESVAGANELQAHAFLLIPSAACQSARAAEAIPKRACICPNKPDPR